MFTKIMENRELMIGCEDVLLWACDKAILEI
jgi:hypothetical protein